MSEHTDSDSDDGGGTGDQLVRPQTVSITRLGRENSNDEGEADDSIGGAFFPPQDGSFRRASLDETSTNAESSNPAEQLTPDNNSSCPDEDQIPVRNPVDTENGSPHQRPKTVTLKSTNERRQRLVDIGAVSSQEDTEVVVNETEEHSQSSQLKKHSSTKPKAERCYICGKEFLLSSLMIHEKQCAKKLAKENEKRGTQENQTARNASASRNPVPKCPRKLKLEACYLCGKEFFIHSLEIHETQCIKNWKADKTPEAKDKTVAERTMQGNKCSGERVIPGMKAVHEQEKSVSEEETKASEGPGANQSQSPKCEKKLKSDSVGRQRILKTTPCYICGVQLLAHSLKVHEKKCQSRKEGSSISGNGGNKALNKNLEQMQEDKQQEISFEESLSEDTKEIQDKPSESGREGENAIAVTLTRTSKKPRTVICYICGQEFLKSSYTVHEKQCASKSKAKAEQEESELANKNTTASRKNDTASNMKREGTPQRKPKTQKCFICGKEMLLSSLRIHEQQCQKKSEILKNINHQNLPQKPKPSGPRQLGPTPKTEVCYICGEAFLSSSIKVHEAQCGKRWNTRKKT